MLKFHTRFFRRNKTNDLFTIENTGTGLRFIYPDNWSGPESASIQAAYQYITLKLLIEEGIADATFHIINENVCILDRATRLILNLAQPWHGNFKLSISGKTIESNFKLNLRLFFNGRPIKYLFDGLFLHIAGQTWLPDLSQWLALSAVKKHGDLEIKERNETRNLQVIYALQQAKNKGLDIDLSYFEKIKIKEPKQIGIYAYEGKCDLLLGPDFGLGIPPEEIEKRLGQIDKNVEAVSMRVGEQIILFDEKKLRAINEILSSRIIPAQEKRQFFKTPGSFLDASLVDLDMGFSLRVHGATTFKKSYFGYSERDSLEHVS